MRAQRAAGNVKREEQDVKPTKRKRSASTAIEPETLDLTGDPASITPRAAKVERLTGTEVIDLT